MGIGTGKTISALTALLDRGMPKTLVVAPKRVARRVWSEEAAAWEHTSEIKINVLQGVSPDKRLIRLHHKSDIDVIGYELFEWLADQINLDKWYQAIVFDEGQKMKTAKASRFKRMRYDAMKIPIRMLLTGHPVGNHYKDLWAEMFAAADERPLGPTKQQFLMQYFTAYEVAENIAEWSLNYGAAPMIHERIKPFAFSLDPKLTNKWDLRFNPITVELPKKVYEMSEELERELRVQLTSGFELLALSSSARSMKVRQMVGGAVYTDPDKWESIHEEKLDALEDVIDQQQGEPILVAYWYRHELERILKRFPEARVMRSRKDEDDWNARKVEVMCIHPCSAGEGLNLQFGGHNIVWFTLPWSFNFFSQLNGRLPRPGQVSDYVMVNALLAGPTDAYVLQYLREQEKNDRATREAVQI